MKNRKNPTFGLIKAAAVIFTLAVPYAYKVEENGDFSLSSVLCKIERKTTIKQESEIIQKPIDTEAEFEEAIPNEFVDENEPETIVKNKKVHTYTIIPLGLFKDQIDMLKALTKNTTKRICK